MNDSNAPKRLYYGWVIVGVAFVAMGLGYGIISSFSLFFVAILEEFHSTRADTALAFSAFQLFGGIASLVVGVLVERFGVRPVMSLGAVLVAVSLAASSQVSELWQYYISLGMLTAIGVSATTLVPTHTILNRWFVARRGLVFGINAAGIGALGMSVMVPFNQYLISTVGWRSAYLVLAVLIIAILPPLAFFLLRERPQDLGLLPDGASMSVAFTGQDSASNRESVEAEASHLRRLAPVLEGRATKTEWTLRSAMRTPSFWLASATFVLVGLAHSSIFVHQAAYLVDVGYSAMTVAWAIGIMGVVSVPSKVSWGAISDRVGRRLAYALGIGCVLVSLAVMISVPALGGTWPLVVYAALYGLGYSVFATLPTLVVTDLFAGRRYPVILGCAMIGGSLAAAVGPWVAGRFYDATGTYSVAFSIAATAAACSAVTLWLAASRRSAGLKPKAAGASATIGYR